MKISINWIKEFVEIPSKYSAKQLAELLTLRTCEVEGYEDQTLKYYNIVVGKILAIRPHPNADKLWLVDTDIGGKAVKIVCGGENLEVGMLVAVALPGAFVKWHGKGEPVELKKTKIRGELSYGMICAEEEIALPALTPRKGITIANLAYHFSPTTNYQPGIPIAQTPSLNDIIFDIDNKSLTHRPDLWGHYGMAREFAAFLGQKLKSFIVKTPAIKRLKAAKVYPEPSRRVKIKIEKPNIALRFLSVIITGIQIQESPAWIKKRLETCGMRPVNNIVDITNYVMHELGHPLHAFDRTVVKNDQFIIRFAKKGEVLETLDHKKRLLNMEDALVTNGEKVLGMAGVIGGLNSEITAHTTEIILEAACWNPVLIRKTAQRHGLRSDAAQRFEKSLDPEITGIAFHRACKLILDLCPGARLAGPDTDLYTKKYKPMRVMLNGETMRRKIGMAISTKEMVKHLEALEFGVKRGKNGMLNITIPSFRATKDINMEDDIIEEIARMHGYEKIPPKLPMLPIRLPQENRERTLKHEARDIFSLGLGFTEVSLYSFYGLSEIQKSLLPRELHIELENPLTEDQTHLRVSLLPNVLKAMSNNLKFCENFKLYEIGRTYIKSETYFPQEEKFICGVVVQQDGVRGEIFYKALGALTAFLDRWDAKSYCIEPCENPPPYSHPQKCAKIMYGNQEVAIVYEVHPQVLKNFDIEANCAVFEINFTKLVAIGQKERLYHPLPRFPGIEIDVSVLVSKKTMVREIQEFIRRADQTLVTKVNLIDIFEDKNLGGDKKSLTFRILLQSPDRTLTDEEMKEIQERIFKTLQGAGFVIRGL